MPDTAVVWFRRDLRVATSPPWRRRAASTSASCRSSSLTPSCWPGASARHARTAWLLECLEALDGSCAPAARAWWCAAGARRPWCGAWPPRPARRRCTSPTTSPASRARATLAWSRPWSATASPCIRHPGLYVADLPRVRRGPGRPLQGLLAVPARVEAQERRPVERAPRAIAMARSPRARLPSLRALGFDGRAPRLQDRPQPGEARPGAPRERWLECRPRPLRRAPRRARRADLAPVGLPALRLPVAARARARRGRPAAGSATATSSRGATSSPPWQLHFPDTARVEFHARYRALRMGRRRRAARAPGARAGPASRSSTPRCASSPPPAGCTTARA